MAIWLLAYILLIGLILGIVYLILKRIIGPEAAGRHLRYSLPWMLLGFAIASLIPLLAQWGPASWNVLYVAYILSVGGWLLSWPYRRRKAGRLLFNAGRTWQNKLLFWLGILEVGVALFVTWLLLVATASAPDYAGAAMQIPKVAFWWTFSLFFLALGFSQLELRERGICFMYSFLPWQRLKSYAWEPSNPSTLTVYLQSRLPLLPSFMSITVPNAYREEIEKIVRDRLPESDFKQTDLAALSQGQSKK